MLCELETPMKLYMYNGNAIKITENPEFHNRTKQFIREVKVEEFTWCMNLLVKCLLTY